MARKETDYSKYLRLEYIPHIWCPGCGHGSIMKSIIRAVDALGLDKDKTALVSGIGCSSRIVGYMDFNTLHTTHGRALAFATGIKMARPELNVIVASGDGDATAIGGNHFIHACRRNIDITLVVFNNFIYGMTGGQYSPTTPIGSYASTSPYGNIDPSFNICRLAEAAGATYVARANVYSIAQADNFIKKGIQNKGFSVIEVITHCPTYYGRKNKLKTPADNLRWQKDVSVSIQKAKKMSEDELKGKIITGEFVNKTEKEYTQKYEEFVIGKAQGKI